MILAEELYLADHSVLLALPALIPVAGIVIVVLAIAVRDRRAEAREAAEQDAAPEPDTGEDHP